MCSSDLAINTNDVALQYECLQFVAELEGSHRYGSGEVRCNPQSFVGYMDRLIKVHYRDEIFKSVEMPVGIPFHDRNKTFFAYK